MNKKNLVLIITIIILIVVGIVVVVGGAVRFHVDSSNGISGLFQILQRRFACTDSDGGLDYYTFGNVTQTYQHFWNRNKTYTNTKIYPDKCIGDKNLIEYYCQKNIVRSKRYVCPNGCNNGACAPSVLLSCSNQGGLLCQEYEVCAGTVLAANDTNWCCQGQCRLPRTFIWTNKHGENWMTSVKNQGSAGTCRTFAPVGVFEAQVNLYYNRHLDLDFSEQIAEDCLFRDFLQDTNICRSKQGYDLIFCKTKLWGLPDEDCVPYVERTSDYPNSNFCTQQYVCPDWRSRTWKNEGYLWYDIHNDGLYADVSGRIAVRYPDDIKKYLILNGPMNAGLIGWNHNMVLSGYETDEEGRVVWLFKNSWGPQSGDNGYLKTIAKENVFGLKTEFQNPDHPQGPFLPPSNKSFWPKGFDGTISCVDKDGDNFCNWGISKNKPASCPTTCKDEKDWDDSNPNIGALGIY